MPERRPYPTRPGYWCNQVHRALIAAEAIPALGRDVCWLISFIAAREDMLHYKQVPKWWTPQLMDDAGFSNKRHFLKTRQSAIDAGWLVVNGGGKGIEGEYFTDIPVQFVGAKSHQQTHQRTVSRCEIAPPNAPLSEPTNAPLPIPYSPIPEEDGASLPAAAATDSQTKRKTQTYPEHFERVWNAYPAKGRKNKAKTFSQYRDAIQRIRDSRSCSRDDAAQLLLSRVQDYSQSHYGKTFNLHAERWFRDDRFDDAPESWQEFSRSAPKNDPAVQIEFERVKRIARQVGNVPGYRAKFRETLPEATYLAADRVGWPKWFELNEFTESKVFTSFSGEFSSQTVVSGGQQ
jgi:hypothetical protein